MIQPALTAYLRANLSNDRIYPLAAPQDARLPCATLEILTTDRLRHYSDGDVATGLIDTEVEITTWAKTMSESTTLAHEVIALLENMRGQMTDTATSPAVTHYIADIEINSEAQELNSDIELYGHSVFLSIMHD